jgi:non-specific serine/threonine protein kinase
VAPREEEPRQPLVRPAARVAAPETAPKAVSAPPPQEPVVNRDKVLCADSNFFARPMCIHRECQKAEHMQLPVCIENRQRYPEGNSPNPP